MNRLLASTVLVLSVMLLPGCASHHQSVGDAASQQFERLYLAWRDDLASEGDGSDNATRQIERPSFRTIVALGKPALPFLQQKLEENRESDGLLAFAVVEICGWDIHEFHIEWNMGEFREKVLKRLRETKS